jgi:hypothetical protein
MSLQFFRSRSLAFDKNAIRLPTLSFELVRGPLKFPEISRVLPLYTVYYLTDSGVTFSVLARVRLR